MSDESDDRMIRDALDRYVPPDGWATDWPTVQARAERRPRSGGRAAWVVAGSAAATFAVLAAVVVGDRASDPNGDSAATPGQTTTHPASGELRDAQTDLVRLRVLPDGEFKQAKPGDECLEFVVTGEPPNYLCGKPQTVRRDGFVGTIQHDDSTITVYGVRPVRSEGVRIDVSGAQVSEDGLLFSAVVSAESRPVVRFVAEGGVVQSSPTTYGSTPGVEIHRIDRATVDSQVPADGECVAIVLKDSAAGPGTEGTSCAPKGTFDRDGLVGTHQLGDGSVLVYGLLPRRADDVAVAGAVVSRNHRVFSTMVAPTKDVTVEFTRGGDAVKTVRHGKAVPQSRHPVPRNPRG